MLYLLDANVLITANNFYYPMDMVPEFWDWLLHMGRNNKIKIPVEIFEEIKDGTQKDVLYDWVQDKDNSSVLLLDMEIDPAYVQKVVSQGYAADLTDDEVEQLGRDPFLVAYALALPGSCVVTTEVSRPGKKRQNRKLPDVCQTLGVTCCDTFALNRALGFRTAWHKSELVTANS